MTARRLFFVAGVILVAAGLVWCAMRWPSQKQFVVVYVSEDQIFSEPILKDFQRDTKIAVQAVYDTEETKSTGVMNRLLAEKENTQADVYWANEPIRAEVLKQKGLCQPYCSPSALDIPDGFKDADHDWTGFSARARVLLCKKGLERKPVSILAYTDARWKGKSAIADPLFGTTTTQVAALFVLWGDERARRFLDRMKENQVKVTSSNGESADLVASGAVDFSLVDSDDGANRMRQGRSVEIIFPDQGADEIGTLVLPNVAILLHGAPHPDNAKRLIDYLLSRETEKKLAFADCAQIPLHPGVEIPKDIPKIQALKVLPLDYAKVARKLQQIQGALKAWVGT